MSRTSLLSGASALALSAFSVFSICLPASAADFTVPSATGNQSVSGNDKGTVASGATLNGTITWGGGSNAPGVIIDNWGTISASGRAIDTGSFSSGSITLNNHEDALITSSSDTFRINTSISNGTVTVNNAGTMTSTGNQVFDLVKNASNTSVFNLYNSGDILAPDNDAIRPGFGTILIENSGLIEASERAINIGEGDLNKLVSLTITNLQGGDITSDDDAIHVGADEDVPASWATRDTTAASITVENAGTIHSNDKQAIDFGDITSPDAKIKIINWADGIISADASDAIRPGQGGEVLNYGTITNAGADPLDDSAIRAEEATDFTVKNYGKIVGAHHGVDQNVDGVLGVPESSTVTVVNYGTITGLNGSGVGSDGYGTVTNYGTITGSYDEDAGEGDGDGVDIDFIGTINNYGTIQGTGADGVENHSEGIAMGGGTINNYAGAVIAGADRGILIDDSNGGNAHGSVSIMNAGTIVGYGGDAITVIGDKDDDLTNYGTIIGNVDLGGGTNILDNKAGGLLEVGTVLSIGAGNTVNNDGTISPGGTGTVETTALTGGLAQSATGALAIDLDAAAGTSDRVDVSEAADLDGVVKLSVAGLAIAGGTTTVLTAGDGVTLDGLELIASPALQAFLIYPDANTVQVSYNLSFAPNIGLTQNETAIGEHLNDAVDSDATKLTDITSALLAVTTDGEYRSALDQLSPEIYGDSAVSTLYGAHAFGNSLLSCHKREAQFAAVSEDECLWAAFTGRTLDQNASAQGLGYDEQTWGFSGGGQVAVAPGLMLGLAGGIEQGNADATNGASADIDRAYAGLALKHVAGPWVVAGAVFGGTGSTDTSRPINFGGLVTTATGDQTVSHLSGRLRVAYQMGGNALYAKPMIDVEATHLWIGSVQEQGGSGALSIASSEETVFSAAPAVEIGGEVMIDGGTLVRPFARLGGVFYSEDHVTITSSFIGGPAGVPGFATQAEVEDVMGNVGAGLDLVWRDGTTIKAQYDGLFGSEVQQHTFSAKASVKF